MIKYFLSLFKFKKLRIKFNTSNIIYTYIKHIIRVRIWKFRWASIEKSHSIAMHGYIKQHVRALNVYEQEPTKCRYNEKSVAISTTGNDDTHRCLSKENKIQNADSKSRNQQKQTITVSGKINTIMEERASVLVTRHEININI